MTPTMPMTSDNIYKFAALLGLALIISAILAMAYVQEKNSDLAFNSELELRILKSKDHFSIDEKIKRELLEERDKAMNHTLSFLINFFAIISILGIFLLLWGGLIWWWRLQPQQDELIYLQIEKTRREIAVLDKQLKKPE